MIITFVHYPTIILLNYMYFLKINTIVTIIATYGNILKNIKLLLLLKSVC